MGTILYSHFYYLIRSGALAGGSLGTSVPVNPNRRRPSVNLQPSSAAALSSLLSVNRSLRHRSIALLALSMSQSASVKPKFRCSFCRRSLFLTLSPSFSRSSSSRYPSAPFISELIASRHCSLHPAASHTPQIRRLPLATRLPQNTSISKFYWFFSNRNSGNITIKGLTAGREVQVSPPHSIVIHIKVVSTSLCLSDCAAWESHEEEDWDFSIDPCSGEGNWGFRAASKSYSAMNAITCDCSFSNNNLGHVVSMELTNDQHMELLK
ncbi:hypothetical protein PIB30_053064 [Stylosanthes scabra]|uniref:GPS domain-containing protein n=1 Tax=Stylosanthes scabra TaxID=79078 RepID=A0ABU6WLR7_9FABA|nr:hypothetical protein [Stylosanthes scabra]